MRENSQNSSTKTLSARYRSPSKRPQIRDCLRNNNGNVFGRLGHRRQSAFKRLSDTYFPSMTKSGLDREYSKDGSYSRGRPHKRDFSPSRDRPRSRDRSHGIKKSYGNPYPSYRIGDKYRYHSHSIRRSSSMKRGRNSESPLSRVSKSGTNERRHWKSKSKRHKPTDEEDLTAPWSCEEVDPFTPRIRNFKSSRKTRMPKNVKTYDGIGDPEGHVKIFQAASQKSIDGYKDLKASFLASSMQQKKYVKDPVEIHNIKQKDGETIKDFIERFKVETGRMKGDPEEKLLSLSKRKFTLLGMSKRSSDFRNQARDGRGSNKFTLLTRMPKEIFMAESGKFRPPPPMVTSVEKRCSNKFCDSTMIKDIAGNEYCIKGQKRSKMDKTKHGETEINKRLEKRCSSQRQSRNHLYDTAMAESDATEVDMPYIVYTWTEAPRWRYFMNTVSTGFHPKIKSQMVLATTSLTGFSGETIWSLGQLRLLVTIGDAEHYTRAWMNFIIVRSPSPYNGIIGRPGIREIQAVPSTAHGMLKFSVNGKMVTIRSTILMPTECTTIAVTPKDHIKKAEARTRTLKWPYILIFQTKRLLLEEQIDKSTNELCTLLKRNLDIFAWHPSDMTRVPRLIVEHRLNIRKGYSPVRQKNRGRPRSAPRQSK
nr:reverse transcriptase domain-containing protein [Tanacetum cinerariifolium]